MRWQIIPTFEMDSDINEYFRSLNESGAKYRQHPLFHILHLNKSTYIHVKWMRIAGWFSEIGLWFGCSRFY